MHPSLVNPYANHDPNLNGNRKGGAGGGGFIPRPRKIGEAQNIQTNWSKKEKDTNCPDLAISRKSGGMALLAPPLLFSFCQLREAQKPKKWRFLTSLN